MPAVGSQLASTIPSCSSTLPIWPFVMSVAGSPSGLSFASSAEAPSPQATSPQATSPQATSPQAAEAQATSLHAVSPHATSPHATSPQATSPQATLARAADCQAAVSRTSEPDASVVTYWSSPAFGFGGDCTLRAAATSSSPTPSERGTAAGVGCADAVSAPLT